jgi:hypothetical protein
MKKTKWIPKVGETYWMIRVSSIAVEISDCNNRNDSYDKFVIKHNNAFRTPAIAQKKLKEIKKILSED